MVSGEKYWALSGTPIKKEVGDWLGIGKALQLPTVPYTGNESMKIANDDGEMQPYTEEQAAAWIADASNIKDHILDPYVMCAPLRSSEIQSAPPMPITPLIAGTSRSQTPARAQKRSRAAL